MKLRHRSPNWLILACWSKPNMACVVPLVEVRWREHLPLLPGQRRRRPTGRRPASSSGSTTGRVRVEASLVVAAHQLAGSPPQGRQHVAAAEVGLAVLPGDLAWRRPGRCRETPPPPPADTAESTPRARISSISGRIGVADRRPPNRYTS